MRIVIDIPDRKYKDIMTNNGYTIGQLANYIKNGTPLPEGAEILTKEAYSDLCLRAAGIEQRTGHWIPVSDPLTELPKDRSLWVTVDDGIFSPHVEKLYYDMTEWSDITAARNAVAYMEYQKPEPYKESEGRNDGSGDHASSANEIKEKSTNDFLLLCQEATQ